MGAWDSENAEYDIKYIICYIYISHHILVGIDLLETLKLDHVLNDVRIVRL